jgi:muconolactone D-isomerase
MDVNLTPDLDQATAADLRDRERARALELQRAGKWHHLWRVVGRRANVSVLNAYDHDDLHAMLVSLPLFPYLDIKVTALAQHPSSLEANP